MPKNELKIMFMKKKLFVSLIIMGAFILPVKAQIHPNTPTDGKVEIVIGDRFEGNNNIYRILIENSPVKPEYTNIPRFAIIGKDHKFYFSVGAALKATTSFDWGNPYDSPSSFIPGDFTNVPAGDGGKWQATANHSKIHFNFVALPGTANQLGVYLAVKFNGSNNDYGVMLSYGYLKYRGFTAGYNTTLYCDQAASPYTIDSEGPNSSSDFSNTVFDYEHNFTNKFKVGLGLELPMTSLTTRPAIPVGSTNVNQRIPDIPMYVQYAWGTSDHIRLSGILRNMQYRDLQEGKNFNSFGWGIKLSGTAKLGPLTTYWMGQVGKGIASYLQDNIGLGVDMVPCPCADAEGRLTNTKSWGAFGGLQYNFSPKVYATAVYSHIRNYMDRYTGGTTTYNDQYNWGQYILGNLIWSVTPNVQTGLEYIYGRRVNMDNAQVHDNRLTAMVFVSF